MISQSCPITYFVEAFLSSPTEILSFSILFLVGTQSLIFYHSRNSDSENFGNFAKHFAIFNKFRISPRKLLEVYNCTELTGMSTHNSGLLYELSVLNRNYQFQTDFVRFLSGNHFVTLKYRNVFKFHNNCNLRLLRVARKTGN